MTSDPDFAVPESHYDPDFPYGPAMDAALDVNAGLKEALAVGREDRMYWSAVYDLPELDDLASEED